MHGPRFARRAVGAACAMFALSVGIILPATQADAKSSVSGGGRELIGLFRLTPGSANGDRLDGTWFRMLEPGASSTNGPYMKNANSSADGGQATLLSPGSAGGFRTNAYQPQPTPAFDAGGNSLAGSITTPTAFFGVQFSISTNKIDLQTKTAVAPPIVVLKNGKLTADLSSWAASWNNQDFNQGAPKPVSSTQAKAPGQKQAQEAWNFFSQKFLGAQAKATITGTGATGTFNPKTGAFTLQWTSLIVGGPFNSFTGLWHLQGVFQPSGRGSSGS
ncbi:MAG TPA: hypothetical protein VGF87_01395 [Acidimicrobiales bacterium]|jgi:hypothetical protein